MSGPTYRQHIQLSIWAVPPSRQHIQLSRRIVLFNIYAPFFGECLLFKTHFPLMPFSLLSFFSLSKSSSLWMACPICIPISGTQWHVFSTLSLFTVLPENDINLLAVLDQCVMKQMVKKGLALPLQHTINSQDTHKYDSLTQIAVRWSKHQQSEVVSEESAKIRISVRGIHSYLRFGYLC